MLSKELTVVRQNAWESTEVERFRIGFVDVTDTIAANLDVGIR